MGYGSGLAPSTARRKRSDTAFEVRIISSSQHDSNALNTAASVDGAAPQPAADGTNPASLDKVRDILFGNQMRDVERRFARLEERLIKETADLKEDVRRRL